MIRFLSRKFILSVLILITAAIVPVVYKTMAVSDSVTMLVLGVIAGVGAAYGVINMQDAKNQSVPPPKVP